MGSEQVVFVVDDDAAVRRAFTLLLESMELQVEAHGSAREFLDAYDPVQPGCLLLDVRMPGMSGPELYKHIKRRWPRTAERVRFMSGAPEWSAQDGGGELEQRCYRKPLEIPELLAELDAIVARRKNPGPKAG